MTRPRQLDSTSHTPLFVQLADHLRAEISGGRYRPGCQLPSENLLMRMFGVSRATAIAALNDLVDANTAYRSRGRGTFVSKPMLSRFSLASSFTEGMLARGVTPSSKTVAFERRPPDADTAAKLGAPAGIDCYCVTRLRLADNHPVALQYAYLPVDLYPGLSEEDFEKNHLYGILRQVYGITPQWTEAIVEAHAAGGQEASQLDVAEGAAVLVVWHLALDESLRSLEYVRSVYRSDRFSFFSGRQRVDRAG